MMCYAVRGLGMNSVYDRIFAEWASNEEVSPYHSG